ncbi:C-type natriuretic peptide 2-like [Siphateles boraxobius]|uniref:C-type natriuretic peptide 2-like n=1 Tax=Siphateles boraxobius TaxID=180520 RepID=UPI004064B14C
MAFSSPLNFTSSLHPALLLFLIITVTTQVEGRPSPRKSDAQVRISLMTQPIVCVQVLQDFFGLKIGSLLLAHPEVMEGSADSAPPFLPRPPSRVFLDVLNRHRKLQGRSRKGMARGCFGMKVDRIGVISGLGC